MKNLLPYFCCIILLSSCVGSRQELSQKDPAIFHPIVIREDLISINIIDRNGLTETIGNKEKLKNYSNINFLTSQPYQKVLRIYAKNSSGTTHSIITSYHTNGSVKQYLEVMNGRAKGTYAEWHENGNRKLLAKVIQGTPDIDAKSQMTWTFHGLSFAWSEEGVLLTQIPYEKGLLHGKALYYHSNKQLIKEIPYTKGRVEGELKRFSETGTLLESTWYKDDLHEGFSQGFWNDGSIAWREEFQDGLLKEGNYIDKTGKTVATVQAGKGKRCIFDDNGPKEFYEIVDGQPEGEVIVLENNSHMLSRYYLKNGEKHGTEIRYFSVKPFEKAPSQPQPKLAIDWYEGKIHGMVKTWYESGIQESQKEMSQNKKQGMLTAWYRNDTLMLIEEYENDKLVRGEYLKRGENRATSAVEKGKGIATLFDGDGNFHRKIRYLDGKPIEE